MSSLAETVTYASDSQVVAAAALEADNAADAGGASGALSAHHHEGRTTIVCIVSGRMRFLAQGPEGEEDFTASAGQIAVIPGGLVHHEENPGEDDCVCIVARNSATPVVVNV